jgi:hypothetical protein
VARLFRLSCHPFQAGHVFRGLLIHHCCGLSGCSPSWTDLTGCYPSHEGFYIQAFSESVTLLTAGYHYDSLWILLSVGLSPTGMTTSFAAPDPHVQNCCMRLLPRMYGVEAQIGIRMKDARFGEPALCKSHKSWPSRPIFLAASP